MTPKPHGPIDVRETYGGAPTMAKVRQARRCRARRKSDGQPCGCYAIKGGFTCRVHGGAAPQVRAAAHLRVVESQLRRGFAHDYARWRQRVAEFEAERVLVAAELLGMAPGQVKPVDIWYCRVRFGRPVPESDQPEMEIDRRFGPRRKAS